MTIGFSGVRDVLPAAEADRHNAAMRTITIMLPVRYNESPPAAVNHQQVLAPDVVGGPSHGPLSGQLLGALPHQHPLLVGGWSARFEVSPPDKFGTDNGAAASEADRDKSAKESSLSSPSPLNPEFVFHMLTGGRYRNASPGWNQTPANEIHQKRMSSQGRPEAEWLPAQLAHRYMQLNRQHQQQQPVMIGHRDGPLGDSMLKNDMVMTALAYGLLQGDDSQRIADSASSSSSLTTSTTTAATVNTNRKRKFSAAGDRHRTSGRRYPHPGGGRRPVRRRDMFDVTLDSDDEDDEILEALFGYERSPPTSFRRVRRPSAGGARRVIGRRRPGDGGGGGNRWRRWRQSGGRDASGKLRRRTGSSGERQAARGRRPSGDKETARKEAAQQRTKMDVEKPDTAGSSRRLSLLHIVVSRQQDFAVPQPALRFADHPGLLQDHGPPPDLDALHSSLSHHPFIQPPPPFLNARPSVAYTLPHRRQNRYDCIHRISKILPILIVQVP